MDMSDDEFKLLDLQGDALRRFSKPKMLQDFEFSKDGATIFFKTNDDSRGDWVDKIIQMDTLGKILKTVRANSKYVSEIKTTPSGKLFGYADSYSFKIIGPNGKPIQLLPYLQGIVAAKILSSMILNSVLMILWSIWVQMIQLLICIICILTKNLS